MINCKSLMVKTLTNNAFFLSLVGTASLEVTTVLDSRILNITLKVKKKSRSKFAISYDKNKQECYSIE